MAGEFPIWVLLGQRTGDNNQLLRLADALGLPFRTIPLRYNALHMIPPRILGPTLSGLTAESRNEIKPPWPQLVLGVGYRSVPVALAIRKLSGGKARLIRLGNPRLDPGKFDLVITTVQYALPDAPNVIRLPVGIPTVPPLEATGPELEWLERLPRPHRLLLIGGNTFMWKLRAEKVAEAARKIADKGGSVIPVSSPRSRLEVAAAVSAGIGVHLENLPRYPVLLGDADEIYITGDSISMVSEAIATGKPVGIIRPEKTWVGRILYALANATGREVPVRDIQRFMDSILQQSLAGTLEQPLANPDRLNSLKIAVSAIRRLLETRA